MLAVRLALTGGAGVLVFDEVDAGIGATAAAAVGAALAELGRRAQVLVVTHLAQVAARADHHLAVTKARGGRPDPLGGVAARRRGPGGGGQPDAVGQPGERHRPAPRPGAARPAVRRRPLTASRRTVRRDADRFR